MLPLEMEHILILHMVTGVFQWTSEATSIQHVQNYRQIREAES